MKSFDVTLEGRVIVRAPSESEAIDLALKIVWGHHGLLIPTGVREGYPKAWEPKKEVTLNNGVPDDRFA
jgi:hypothetical protein